MKKVFLFAVFVAAGFSSYASSAPLKTVSAVPQSLVRPVSLGDQCTFSAKVTVSVFGQSAEMSCSSSNATCEVAINAVASCIKKAKNKILDAAGI